MAGLAIKIFLSFMSVPVIFSIIMAVFFAELGLAGEYVVIATSLFHYKKKSYRSFIFDSVIIREVFRYTFFTSCAEEYSTLIFSVILYRFAIVT